MPQYLCYGEKETEYLKKQDERLAALIDAAGHIQREAMGELYPSLVDCIIGQQISTAAHNTIRQRVKENIGEVSPKAIYETSDSQLQALGLSWRKVGYIKDFTKKIVEGEFSLDSLDAMSDQEVIEHLVSLKGVGKWTAEMLMTFSMQRPDVLSYGDLAIRRGICRLYKRESITEKEFDALTEKFSPYRTVAALYFWYYANPSCTLTID